MTLMRAATFTTLAGAALAALPLAPASAAPLPRPAQFAICSACHVTEAGKAPGIGPNLWQVGGRKAGSTGFAYSAAMKGAGITWNKDTLTKFVSGPQAVVPGTKMAFGGLKDPKAADAVVAYLLSLK